MSIEHYVICFCALQRYLSDHASVQAEPFQYFTGFCTQADPFQYLRGLRVQADPSQYFTYPAVPAPADRITLNVDEGARSSTSKVAITQQLLFHYDLRECCLDTQ